jgi:hypothetical protein
VVEEMTPVVAAEPATVEQEPTPIQIEEPITITESEPDALGVAGLSEGSPIDSPTIHDTTAPAPAEAIPAPEPTPEPIDEVPSPAETETAPAPEATLDLSGLESEITLGMEESAEVPTSSPIDNTFETPAPVEMVPAPETPVVNITETLSQTTSEPTAETPPESPTTVGTETAPPASPEAAALEKIAQEVSQ